MTVHALKLDAHRSQLFFESRNDARMLSLPGALLLSDACRYGRISAPLPQSRRRRQYRVLSLQAYPGGCS